MSHSPVPKFKTLKVALMCPPSLQKKYSQGNLQAITGGLVNYFMILANMVSPTFSRVCVVFYRQKKDTFYEANSVITSEHSPCSLIHSEINN